jgi:hypothetical protein
MDAVQPDEAATECDRRCANLRAAHKRLDPIDGPRALGEKRFALQAQRRRQAVIDWHVGLFRPGDGPNRSVLVSTDGTIAFAIGRTRSGLLVEKRSCPITGPRTSHAMIFETESIFDHWCDIEPTRFDDPLLCDQLRRRGHELFAKHG